MQNLNAGTEDVTAQDTNVGFSPYLATQCVPTISLYIIYSHEQYFKTNLKRQYNRNDTQYNLSGLL